MADLEGYDSERLQYTQYLRHESENKSGQQHEMSTTPLCSLRAKHIAESEGNKGKILPQYWLLGFNVNENECVDANEPIMLNTNAPNSVFICGSQGSEKSYTLSAMLENLLHPTGAPGKPGKPVAGVIFHYDHDSSGSVAEAAHLASMGIKVDVLVSPSHENARRRVYTNELAKSMKNVQIRPLEFRSKDLSVARMHKLMAFTEQDGKVPLYMEVILRILRELAKTSQGGDFNYTVFRNMLDEESERFTREQCNPMNLRLQLLESFMVPNARKSKDKKSVFNLEPETLTVIDLSDPFLDAATVCVLFDICLSLAKDNAPAAGLVVALDEAHKYMNKSLAATNFTDHLLTVIREQRHKATRVIISTQEPTLSDKLLDLCSMTIVHRFTSPAWFEAIKNHLSGASSLIAEKEEQRQTMSTIVGLDTGESLLFSPSSYLCVYEGRALKLGSGYLRMKTRLRIGADGGESKMARADNGVQVNGTSNGGTALGQRPNGLTNGTASVGLKASMWSS